MVCSTKWRVKWWNSETELQESREGVCQRLETGHKRQVKQSYIQSISKSVSTYDNAQNWRDTSRSMVIPWYIHALLLAGYGQNV